MFLRNFSWLLFFFFLSQKVAASEKAVLDHIFKGYDPRIRPIKNTSLPVIVQINPQLFRLIEVNEQQEFIKLLLSLGQSWTDEFLTWNPADYNDTKTVTVPTTALWLPDTTIITTSSQDVTDAIYGSFLSDVSYLKIHLTALFSKDADLCFEPEQVIDKSRQMVRISSDGKVVLSSPLVLSNRCPMKTDDFPYDEQNCIVKVTSWLYPNSEILLEARQGIEATKPRMSNSEWKILPVTCKINDLAAEDGQYRQILYTLTIQRKPAYYFWVVIMPTFIITVLSIAGIFAPFDNIGDRQEKFTLGLTTLLTLAVILSMVTGEMPRSTNIPLLGQFVLVEIAIIVICMALSVVVLFFHQRTTTRHWPVPFRLAGGFVCSCRKDRKNKTGIIVPFSRPTQNTFGQDRSAQFLIMIDQLKAKENIKTIGISMKMLDETIAKVNGCIDKMENETKVRDVEEERKDQSLILFDYVDLLLLIVFQTIHVVLYVTLYHHAF